MSVISVYRTFHWTKGRLAGYTGYVWETKEEQARCIKDALGGTASAPWLPLPVRPPTTKEQEQRDARYHITSQFCLCGIHGYFSPNYLGLVAVTAVTMGDPDRAGPRVHARVRLGGLVDIHSMGARGEYGLIEEAWCDNDDIAKAVAKWYGIPVNQSEFEKQPCTDPLIDKDTKILKLSPLFADISEAVVVKGSFGPITSGPSVGMKTIITQKISGQVAGSMFGQAIASKQYRQYIALLGGSPSPTSPFSTLAPVPSGLGSAPGGSMGPMALRLWNAKYPNVPNHGPGSLVSSAVLGNPPCSCGICRGVGRASLSLWTCQVCGKREVYSSDHVRCSGAPPKIVLKPIGIDTANSKPGIIARIKRALGRRGPKV